MRLQILRSILDYLHASDSRFCLLLISSPWFRRSIALCLIIAIGVPLSTVKFFRSTPAHVNLEYRMSVLDWFQAKAFARAARTSEGSIGREDRFGRWRMAIANNPGSLELNRSYLESLMTFDSMRFDWHDAIRTSLWLQKLSKTNLTDLELACRTFEHYRLDHMVIDIVEAYEGEPSQTIEECYLSALFGMGEYEKFRDYSQVVGSEKRESVSLSLSQAASNLIVGDSGESKEAQAILDVAKQNWQTTDLAHRLQLRVSFENKDLPGFLSSWSQVLNNFADTTQDNIMLWEMLRQAGRIEDARTAARSYNRRPRTSNEVTGIADALTKLGMGETALAYLENYSTVFGFQEANWHAQALHLMREGNWDKLARLSVVIRSSADVTMPLIAFSYFIEGKAEYERNRFAAAKVAFATIENFSMLESYLGLYVGSNLWDLGFVEAAFAAVYPERERYRNNLSFWDLLFDVSVALGRQGAMLQAAQNLYRLDPLNGQYRFHYASILLSQRIQLEEALALTFSAATQFSDRVAIQLNYGQALMLNDRDQEAKNILISIDEGRFSPEERNAYNFVLAELHFREKLYKAAWASLQKVDGDLLLPGDRLVFRTLLGKIGVINRR